MDRGHKAVWVIHTGLGATCCLNLGFCDQFCFLPALELSDLGYGNFDARCIDRFLKQSQQLRTQWFNLRTDWCMASAVVVWNYSISLFHFYVVTVTCFYAHLVLNEVLIHLRSGDILLCARFCKDSSDGKEYAGLCREKSIGSSKRSLRRKPTPQSKLELVFLFGPYIIKRYLPHKPYSKS